MPGSGKSTVGRLVAEKLGLDFYDLDAEIESVEKRTIADIFAEGGEDLFRKLEANALKETIAGPNTFVMAAGGGTPCFFKGMQLMNGSGITIYLDTPIDLLIKRTKRKQHRPLLSENHAEKMKELLSTRLNCYTGANYQLKTRDLNLAEKVEKIVALLTDEH